ncbi:uncharacterized protein [Procambarus clarkii]|uniref:uncharacterized protein isoform X2 n=1 Tax=Procambarus clarkii TaxID=6728 RepID=UPI0037434346
MLRVQKCSSLLISVLAINLHTSTDTELSSGFLVPPLLREKWIRTSLIVTEYKEFQSKSVAFGGNILLEGKTFFEKHKGFVNHKLLSWSLGQKKNYTCCAKTIRAHVSEILCTWCHQQYHETRYSVRSTTCTRVRL